MKSEKTKIADNYKQSVMKSGDYEIHVLIEASSGLSLIRSSDIDAMISIKAFDKVQYTKVKKNVGFEGVVWGEHFYFEKTFGDDDNVDQKVILIEAWDHNKILQNSLIGSYIINVQRIYSQNDHAIKHKWLALTDSTNNFGEIAGYVKISISVIHDSDAGTTLDIEPIEEGNKQRQILMPPHIERKSYQLTIEIYQGESLKPTDGSTCDSFIGVQFGKIYEKTEVVPANCNPYWGERIMIPVHLPAIIDNIILRVIDANIVQKSEVIGSYYFNISRLINESKAINNQISNISCLQWINVYGPQIDSEDGEAKRMMYSYPDKATYFVGKLLVKAKMELKNAPTKGKEKIEAKLLQLKPLKFYRIQADIELAINLPSDSKKYKIGIRIGADYAETNEWANSNNGYCIWQVTKKFSIGVYQNQELPDAFVYLVNSNNKKISYKRKKIILGNDGANDILTNKWRSLKPDLTVLGNKVIYKETAGYIKMGVKISKSDKIYPPSETKIDKFFSSINKTVKGSIVIDLYCAESLLAGDDDGSTDPKFIFNYQGNQVQSSTKQSILNPVYYERLILSNVEIGEKQDLLPMIVKVLNVNKVGDQLIGSCYVNIEKGLKEQAITVNSSANAKPVWYDLVIEDMKYGKFLLGINIFRNSSVSIPKKIEFAKKMFTVNLFILGLRGLKSNGVVSIRNPYLEFDFDTLYFANTEDDSSNEYTKNIKTQPRESGNSINIKIPTKTILKLPENIDYWPCLSAKVKDYIIGGLYEPNLGYFSINLREAYIRTKKMQEEYRKNNSILSIKQSGKAVNGRLRDVNSEVIISLRNFVIKNINYNWPTISKKLPLLKSSEFSKTNKIDNSLIVVLPCYAKSNKGIFKEQFIERFDANGDYMKVGYDKKENVIQQRKSACNKHYRFCLDCPYEDYYFRVNETKLGIYDQIAVRRGKVLTKDEKESSLSRLFSSEDIQAGVYKGNCFITELNPSDKQTSDFEVEAEKQLREYMKESKVMMYLYILQARQLANKDVLSESDPYVVVNLGDREISFKDKYISDNNNPEFNLALAEQITFPANSEIEIQVWDYDPIGKNQLIGSTTLHAENRVFSQFGKINFNNPIETHRLKAKQSKIPQGRIRFWVDFIPIGLVNLYKEFDISNKPPSEFQLRIVVWGCSEILADDHDITDMNDLFVTCTFDKQTQQTDVHLRAQGGEGSFNWRMVFPVKLPIMDTTLTIKIYDKDIFSRDQYLASGSYSVCKELKEAYENQTSLKFYWGSQDLSEETGLPSYSQNNQDSEMKYDSFYLPLKNRVSDRSMEQKTSGKVLISIELLTKSQAQKKKVGLGRNAPNMHPTLTDPKGRMQWSWNPLTMLNRLVGKGLKQKICIALICLLALILLWYFIPSFLGALLAKAI